MKVNDFNWIYIFKKFTGKVYKGEIHVSKTDPVLQVAIKTLKENATLKTQQDFRREVELMSELRHPNIVCLLGVVKRQQPYAMLFEYMTQVLYLIPFKRDVVVLFKKAKTINCNYYLRDRVIFTSI